MIENKSIVIIWQIWYNVTKWVNVQMFAGDRGGTWVNSSPMERYGIIENHGRTGKEKGIREES